MTAGEVIVGVLMLFGGLAIGAVGLLIGIAVAIANALTRGIYKQ